MSKIVKRIISFLVIFCFLFLIVFSSINRPKVVKAEVVGGVALGIGALTAIFGSYFAASGLDLSFNGASGSDINSWYNNLAQSHGAVENGYFDQYGNLTDDSAASLILGGVGGSSFWIFSKTFSSWLDGIKKDVVSDYNLTTSNISTFYSKDVINFRDNQISYLTSGGNLSFLPLSGIPLQVGSYSYMFSSDFGYKINISNIVEESNRYVVSLNYSVYNHNSTPYSSTSTINCPRVFNGITYQLNDLLSLNFFYDTSLNPNYLRFVYHVRQNFSVDPYRYNTIYQLSLNNVNNITSRLTYDGVLTDGYADFQDALDHDLASESENDYAVVGLDVGQLEGILTGQAAIEDILQKIYSDTLVSDYEGVFENQEEAERELDSNNEVVTPDWSPSWVVVNGLEDFFPFCIPFDLYEIIRLLNVAPQAPRFTWRMGFGSQFQSYDVDIDLSPYETVARVFRIMAIIGFVLFLTIKTRDLIRG